MPLIKNKPAQFVSGLSKAFNLYAIEREREELKSLHQNPNHRILEKGKRGITYSDSRKFLLEYQENFPC
jgi:hypothetical protein